MLRLAVARGLQLACCWEKLWMSEDQLLLLLLVVIAEAC